MTARSRPVRSWLVVTTMCFAVMMAVTNTTSVGMAIPQMGRAIGADQSELQWIVDSYLLVLAALLLPAGALLDRYGRRKGIELGLGILTVTLLWMAWADSPGVVITARVLAGVGAALILPGTLATMTAVLPPEKRGIGVALWATSMLTGGLVGVLFGGICLEVAWWGSIFAIAAIGAVVNLVFVAIFTPETSEPEHAHLDPMGALLSIIGVGAVVLGVTEGPVRGWTDPLTVGALIVGPLGLAAFAGWELRTARPMLDLRLFKHRSFSAGTAAVFVCFLATYAWFFLTVQHMAFALGYDELKIGVAYIPTTPLMFPLALLGPKLSDKFGRRAVVVAGLGAMTVTTCVLAVQGSAGYWPLVGTCIVFLGALALIGAPATEAIIEGLPAARQGLASAVNDVARELGAAFGIAFVGSAFNAGYRERVGELLGAGPAAEVVRSSPGAGLAVAAQSGDQGAQVTATVRDGVISGWTAAWVVVAVCCAVGTVVVAARFPARDGVRSPAPGPEPAPAT